MTDFIPHEAPAKEVTALPLMPPSRPIGRDDLLKTIYTALQNAEKVLLYGEDGAGKTALAGALAHAYTQQAGGVLWLNGNVRPLSALLVQVGRAYRAQDITTSEQPQAMVGAVASLLLQHKPFIVLENAQDALVVQQFVEKCVGNLPMIIVSPQALHGDWRALSVDKLSDRDSVLLFKQKAGITDDKHDIDLYGISKLCGYLPLALVISARAMVAVKQTPADFFKVLEAVYKTLNGNALLSAIATSYRALSNPLQGLILLLGATPQGEASVELLSMAGGATPEAIDQAMTILSQLYLVEKFSRYGQPYYRMPAPVHQFAQTTLKGSNRLEALQTKIKETFLAYVRKNSASPMRLATEFDALMAMARTITESGDRTFANEVVGLLVGTGDFIKGRGYVYELLQLRQLGSGATSAFPAYGADVLPSFEDEEDLIAEDEELFDTDFLEPEMADEDEDEDEDEVGSFFSRYDVDTDDDSDDDFYEEDEDEESLFDSEEEERISPSFESATLRTDALASVDIEQLRVALNQAKQQRDLPRQVQILKAIGKVQVKQEKQNEAILTYNEILQLQESTNDNEGILETLDMLTALLAKTNNSQASVMHATRGLQLADELDDNITKLSLLMTLGDARQELGESDSAVKVFSQALHLARQSDDRQHEALALYKLGYAQLDNGESQQAVQTWEQARALFKEQGKRDYEGRVLGGIGSAYADMELWGESIRYHQSALYIAREVGDRTEEALQLGNLAQAQVQANKLPEALLSYRQALYVAYLNDSKTDIVNGVVDLVRLMMKSNRLLGVCQLLLQDAENYDPLDRDVQGLSQMVSDKLAQVGSQGVVQAPVTGTARDYAKNAYMLLEN